MSNITLTVPQWTVGATPIKLFDLRGSLTFTNAITLTSDPVFGSAFSNTSNALFLTGSYITSSTPGSLFVLKDQANTQYPINLIVYTPTYTNPLANVVYTYDPITNLPLNFIAPTTASCSVVFPSSAGFMDSLTIGPTPLFNRTVSIVFSSFNISPQLPNGLITTISRATGNITISGGAIVPRASTTYTLFARSDANQTASNTFQLQVAPARFQFSNVSGTVVADSNVTSILSYKQSNDIRIGCRPAPSSINVGVLPTGMTVSLIGSNIVFSGTPTVFFDPSFSTSVTAVGIYASTRLNCLFGMTPSLEIIAPPIVQVYSNLQYTAATPMITASVRGYPIACNSFFLRVTGTGLNINQTGSIFGTLTSNVLATIDASGYNALSNRLQVQFNVRPDTITFDPAPVNYSVVQNTNFYASFAAKAESGQSIIYSVSPLLDGPIGLSIDTVTGNITGTPRGVSTQSNYRIVATTPFGATASFSISIVTIPDQINLSSSYGMGQYCDPSSLRLSMIQGYPILSNDYSANTLKLLSTTRSGDPISAYLQGSFPSGITLNQDGTLTGTPLVSGDVTGTFTIRSLNGITTTGTIQFSISPDALFLTSPLVTDFVARDLIPEVYTLSGFALSKSRITSFGVANVPFGLSAIVTGQQLRIAMLDQREYSGSPFYLTAATDKGIIIRTRATITHTPNSYSGRFISPSVGQTIILPSGSTFPILTNPTGGTVIVDGSSDVGVSGSNLIRLSTGPIYPPQVIVIKEKNSLISQIPVRVTTTDISPFFIGGTRWTQYVPIDSVTLSASSTTKFIFTVPNPPNGILWNPITSTLTNGPCNLTIRDSFTAYATDGFTTKSFTIPYSVAAPVYLRIFSAPSAYTNYVKQRAFINAAVHSIDNTAFLPDEMITTQTGPYPNDVIKDTICLTRGTVTTVTDTVTPLPTSGPGLSMNPFWSYYNYYYNVISSTLSSFTVGTRSSDYYLSFTNFYPNFSCTFPTYPNNIWLGVFTSNPYSFAFIGISSNGIVDTSTYNTFNPLTRQSPVVLSGSNLTLVATNNLVYWFDRETMVGVSTGNGILGGNIFINHLTGVQATFQNPIVNTINTFPLDYQMFNIPSGGNWSTQFTPCNSIAMIGSGTHTTFSYLETQTLNNSTITAQIVNSNVSGAIGLLPGTSTYHIFPTTEMTLSYGVVFDGNTSTAYVNANGSLTSIGAYSNLDQYAASFTRESFSAFKNGVSVFSISIGGIGDAAGARGGIQLTGNGSSFSPVYFGSSEVIQYQRTAGQFDRWATANSFIEKKTTDINSVPLLVNSRYSNTLFNFTVKSLSSDAVFTVTGPSSPAYLAISILSGILTATNLISGNVVTQFSITNFPLVGLALSNSQIQVTSNSINIGNPISVTRPPTWQLAIAKQNAGVVTTDFATYSI